MALAHLTQHAKLGDVSHEHAERTLNRPPDRVAAARAAVAAVALLACLPLIGWVVELVRFATAQLPAFTAAKLLGLVRLFADGALSVALALAVFCVGCVLAWLSSRRSWEAHGQDWHDLISEHGVRHAAAERARQAPSGARPPLREAPLGDWAVRLIAGFNIGVLAAVLAICAGRFAAEVAPPGWSAAGIAVGAIVLVAVRFALTRLSPLAFDAHFHAIAWLGVTALSLFVSAPLGVLGLTGVLLATFGRKLGRIPRPRDLGQFLRSPLPWILLAICLLLSLAYDATAPVGFPGAVARTTTGLKIGGLLARSDGGAYQVLCTSLANATSSNERVAFTPRRALRGLRITGTDYVDSGERPTLLGLAFDALRIDAHAPTIFNPALRAREPTCAGARNAPLTAARGAPSLGAGVITGQAPITGRAAAGEPPINKTTPLPIARLARRYAPTLLVTVADQNWPVSLGAVLAERGPRGATACLIEARAPRRLCPVTPSSLSGGGARSSDYLQLPVQLAHNQSPAGQFRAFLRGLQINAGSTDSWLADPGRLDPWASAEFYFYYAGPISASRWPKGLPDKSVAADLIGLEYWFFYPFNYYPTVVDKQLMDGAPLAGDQLNTDLHQGDWEHIDVLLDPHTLLPQWIYLARHSNEGMFIRWSSHSLRFDGGHAIVQAAFGGHPTYLPGCGAQAPRAVLSDLSSDWLVCGSGRFAFRGSTTPLVDLARPDWGCWPGHFGEARTPLEVQAANRPETLIDQIRHAVFVAGPRSPLRQAENAHVCKGNPRAAELSALLKSAKT